MLCGFETKTQWLFGFYAHIVTCKVQLLFSKHSSRTHFSFHIFIWNTNIQASQTFVSAAAVAAERRTRLCPLLSLSPRSLFIPAASSHLSCLRSDTWGGNGNNPRCVSFTVTANFFPPRHVSRRETHGEEAMLSHTRMTSSEWKVWGLRGCTRYK